MQSEFSYTRVVDQDDTDQRETSDWAVEREERGDTTIFWYLDKDRVFTADFYTKVKDGAERFFASLWFTSTDTRIHIRHNNMLYRITDTSASLPSQTKQVALTVFKEAVKKVSEHQASTDEE